MLPLKFSNLTTDQIIAVESIISSVDDLVESATNFVKNGGQSYKSFLDDRTQLITKICDLPNIKKPPKTFVLKLR